MKVYEQVEKYMNEVGLKYIKNANDFISGIAYRTKDREYTTDIMATLNSRAEGAPTDNTKFYELKNKYFEASLYISAAFDSGLFRHVGNMIMDNTDMFKGSVLDMACDCGITTCFMARCYPDCHFVGIDVNPLAIENAKKLAEKVNVSNVEFICANAYEMDLEKKFDTVTSFRVLLDIADDYAHHLPFVGLRKDRENDYKEAFSKYAKVISNHLADGGYVFSVERYTAEYGWLGWMDALRDEGVCAIDGCDLMRAQDISSTKEYSVTYAKKEASDKTSLDIFNDALSKQFKSGTGYEGGMAEFALYYDADGEIEFTDVYKKKRIIHQYAFATAKNGKRMYFDAGANKRKIKYYNAKKEEQMQKDFDKKLSLYSDDLYSIKKYTV